MPIAPLVACSNEDSRGPSGGWLGGRRYIHATILPQRNYQGFRSVFVCLSFWLCLRSKGLINKPYFPSLSFTPCDLAG